MELVAALEATAREVYTGAIGIASPLSGLELNVAIRTFEVARGKVWLGVGGGVVADSDPDLELEECLDKARPLLAAIGAELDSSLVRPQQPGRRPAAVRSPELARPRRWRLRDDPRPRRPARRPRVAPRQAGGERLVPLRLASAGPPRGRRDRDRGAGSPVLNGCGCTCYPSTGGGARDRALDLAGSGGVLRSARPAGRAGAGRRPGRPRPPQVARSPDPRRTAQRPRPPRRTSSCCSSTWTVRVLETERANVFAVSERCVRTPPADGRILPGTTREIVIRAARCAWAWRCRSSRSRSAELGVGRGGAPHERDTGASTPVGELRGERSWRTGPVTCPAGRGAVGSLARRESACAPDCRSRYAPAAEPSWARGEEDR